eukprot:CAMPEP_0202364864 /NCGR_PEP_ID=MMETSP1126-20121109/16103_1 /ASSEMBLY_ACC=CAM_ASM_000457 /TAXON_ID=3047 /ORGANISM="Dunaliella tertiolecta, Strain CCMP1320" /LENGTH=104 /DNA_ID=CAMNT_0048959595 /DNA_START=340 /DNA_END=654 /DNA_ORIENTATION=+
MGARVGSTLLLPSRPAMLAPTPVAAVLLMGSPPSPPLSCSAWSLDIATGLSPNVKNWCMEMSTMETPRMKFTVRLCPNSTQLMRAVNMVAIVELYFFRMVSAYL